MTKNTKTYLLLAIVLCIWGAIAYKIILGLSPTKTPSLIETDVVAFKPKEGTKKDTFSIVANYRDPFLGTIPKKKEPKRAQKTIVEVPEIPISYTGSVISSEQKNSIFFVTLEGKQLLLKPKQTVQGITLISGSEKQIRIRHQGKLRTILLQQ